MTRKAYNKHWPRKNLGEFLNFLDRLYPNGYTLQEISDKTGQSKQYLSNLFTRDDARLSKLEKYAERLGYQLMLYFPQKTRLLADLHDSPRKDYPNAGNLTGLVRYLQDSNISVNHMSVRLGRSFSLVMNAFRSGDINVSTLYDILKNLNIDVMWKFEKKDS